MDADKNPNGSRLPELYKKALHLPLWKYFKACDASYVSMSDTWYTHIMRLYPKAVGKLLFHNQIVPVVLATQVYSLSSTYFNQ